VPAVSLRLRFAPSPRNGARGQFATDVASGVAAQQINRWLQSKVASHRSETKSYRSNPLTFSARDVSA